MLNLLMSPRRHIAVFQNMNDCHLKELLKFLFKAPWVEFGKFCKNVVSQGQNELLLNVTLPLLEIVKQNLDQ